MKEVNDYNCKPFYDCNLPQELEGYKLVELSEDIWQYQHLCKRVEIIGNKGREFVKLLKEGYFEVSFQDDGKTIKLFEKEKHER